MGDFPVACEKSIRYAGKLAKCRLILIGYWFLALICAGHNPHIVLFQHENMYRSVGKHYPKPGISWSHSLRQYPVRLWLFPQKHDGGCGAFQKLLLLRTNLAKLRRPLNASAHYRKGLVFPVLPASKLFAGVFVGPIAGKMIAADALYCYDLSLAYGLYSTFHRFLSLLGKSPSIPLAKLVHKLSLHIDIFRTAFFTGIRLGMKSSVHRVFVLPLTVRTHFEILHGGKRPVIGDILYYAIPGTAACAVGKGIAVPPVIFIQYFPFALMANCQIWGNKGFMLRPNGTLENGKIQRFICFLNFRQIQGFNGINYRSLWSFFHNIINKIIDNL